MSTDDASTHKPEDQGVNGNQPNGQPEQAEEALVKESIKAGVPAFQFDPASPPQEKARVAREVRAEFPAIGMGAWALVC